MCTKQHGRRWDKRDMSPWAGGHYLNGKLEAVNVRD